MYVIISTLVIIIVVSFLVSRKMLGSIVSDASPFSFADDILIINTGSIFSLPSSSIEYIKLQYNPKALQNRFYDMKIQIVKADGTHKSIRYRGSRDGAQPQAMAAALTARRIKCLVNE